MQIVERIDLDYSNRLALREALLRHYRTGAAMLNLVTYQAMVEACTVSRPRLTALVSGNDYRKGSPREACNSSTVRTLVTMLNSVGYDVFVSISGRIVHPVEAFSGIRDMAKSAYLSHYTGDNRPENAGAISRVQARVSLNPRRTEQYSLLPYLEILKSIGHDIQFLVTKDGYDPKTAPLTDLALKLIEMEPLRIKDPAKIRRTKYRRLTIEQNRLDRRRTDAVITVIDKAMTHRDRWQKNNPGKVYAQMYAGQGDELTVKARSTWKGCPEGYMFNEDLCISAYLYPETPESELLAKYWMIADPDYLKKSHEQYLHACRVDDPAIREDRGFRK